MGDAEQRGGSERATPKELEHAIGAGAHDTHHPVFDRFTPWQGTVAAGWDVNFLGALTRVEYFSLFERLADFSQPRQIVTQYPIPNEDYFEWVDLLEAVNQAHGCFRMIELGAGWGKWIVNGALAARRLGLEAHVVGVEAEPKHFAWMRRHLEDNGVADHATAIRAAVAPRGGKIPFHIGAAADWYGQGIETGAVDRGRRMTALRERLRRGDRPHVRMVKAVSVMSLLEHDDPIDLIDSDVQGAEADVFEAAGERLSEVVRRVHIGTHSSENEDRLRALFLSLAWRNLNDYPGGTSNETPYGPMPFEDGIQTWINPHIQ